MIFTNDKPIFQQMADRLEDEILALVYQDDDRIPSVREYAVSLEVNTNTAVKAYEQLARANIIYNKRGMGYYVTPGAREQILQQRRQAFLEEQLPELFRQMRLLDIGIGDVEQAWSNQQKEAEQ
ncbi:MAG: GntR family transcriptional regulator [Prevotella sp.]|nr:GntR family transcriptional regulator [Prevotella sp.]